MARETVTVDENGNVIDVEPIEQPRRSRYQPTAPEGPAGHTRRQYENAGKTLLEGITEYLVGEDENDVNRAKSFWDLLKGK